MTVQESSIEVNPGDPSSRSGGTRDDMLLVRGGGRSGDPEQDLVIDSISDPDRRFFP